MVKTLTMVPAENKSQHLLSVKHYATAIPIHQHFQSQLKFWPQKISIMNDTAELDLVSYQKLNLNHMM